MIGQLLVSLIVVVFVGIELMMNTLIRVRKAFCGVVRTFAVGEEMAIVR